jgi:hypothetical protein
MPGKALVADQSLGTPLRLNRPSCVGSELFRVEETLNRSVAIAGSENASHRMKS